jgi:hypothetical protein
MLPCFSFSQVALTDQVKLPAHGAGLAGHVLVASGSCEEQCVISGEVDEPQNLKEPLIIPNLSLPRRRESSIIQGSWIPAGVYPDGNRDRNDVFGGSLK